MCVSLAEKSQDQALELSCESRNADDYSTSSLLPFEPCVKAGCVREEMHRRGIPVEKAQGRLQPSLPHLSWLQSSAFSSLFLGELPGLTSVEAG